MANTEPVHAAVSRRSGVGFSRVWVAVAVVLIGLMAGSVLPGTVAAGNGKAAINTIGSNGVAIRGYDPVAYFRAGGPVRGAAEHALEHGGATWHFSSAENRALFAADPDKYMPAYGGYCAYGVSKGGLYKIEADAWSIRNGRLYLNFDRSVQAKWSKTPDEYVASADRKWPGLVAK